MASTSGRRWDSVGPVMRGDERFYFFLAAGVFSICILYTTFGQLLPALQGRHMYTYAHCTATGAGHWEKYGTFDGIMERVVVPVEVRIGSIEDAMKWDSNGTDVMRSLDTYHQAIARDTVRLAQRSSPSQRY